MAEYPPQDPVFYDNSGVMYEWTGDESGYHGDQMYSSYEYSNEREGLYNTSTLRYRSSTSYIGTGFTSRPPPPYKSPTTYEDEIPLSEELGINFNHISLKTNAVLNPFKIADASIVNDTDLAGPLVFCIVYGGLLLLTGKLQFSYIYGISMVGSVGMYVLLNLMALSVVSVRFVISVLGYCLLPMLGLAAVGVILPLGGFLGFLVSGIAVSWCSLAASKLFVTALDMNQQQPLVAYPCAMIYGMFALLAVF